MTGLSTTWAFQVTSDTSGMSLFLCDRCCTSFSTTWWRGSLTGTSRSSNSDMCWRWGETDHGKLSTADTFLHQCPHQCPSTPLLLLFPLLPFLTSLLPDRCSSACWTRGVGSVLLLVPRRGGWVRTGTRSLQQQPHRLWGATDAARPTGGSAAGGWRAEPATTSGGFWEVESRKKQ